MTRALLEAKEDNLHNEEGMESFDELVREMTSKRQDIKTFAFKTKAMVLTSHIILPLDSSTFPPNYVIIHYCVESVYCVIDMKK